MTHGKSLYQLRISSKSSQDLKILTKYTTLAAQNQVYLNDADGTIHIK